MAKLNRKSLKRNLFVEEVGHQVGYLTEHRNTVILAGAIALALIVGAGSFWSYQQAKTVESRQALNKAVDLFHGSVSLENRPGYITYATTLERIRRVSEAMEAVIADYSGSPQSTAAEYYLGLLDSEQDKAEEATKRFQTAINGSDAEYAALARMALGDMLHQSGKSDDARKHYDQLIAKPTRVVPKGRAQIALAHTYASSDPAKAREILTEVQQEAGPAGILAATALQELMEGS